MLVIVTGEGVNMSFSDLFGETRLRGCRGGETLTGEVSACLPA